MNHPLDAAPSDVLKHLRDVLLEGFPLESITKYVEQDWRPGFTAEDILTWAASEGIAYPHMDADFARGPARAEPDHRHIRQPSVSCLAESSVVLERGIHPVLDSDPCSLDSVNGGVLAKDQPGKPKKRRPRNGKIARLPAPLRDMVNRMLRNNLPYERVVGALDEHDITVTERNVSNWKTRGGYKDWCEAQDRAIETRLLQDNLFEFLRRDYGNHLGEVGLQLAATQLSQFFASPLAAEILATDPERYGRLTAFLCRINTQLGASQKYRDESTKALGPKYNPIRIRREEEDEVELTRKVYSSAPQEDFNEPLDTHRNYMPKN